MQKLKRTEAADAAQQMQRYNAQVAQFAFQRA